MTSTVDATASFHNHLSACARCRTSPFDLCDEGRRRLEDTGHFVLTVPSEEARAELRSQRKRRAR